MQNNAGSIILETFKTSALHLCARAPDSIRIGEVREDICAVHGTKGFKSRGTLREALVHTQQPQPALKRKGVVYQVPCADCDSVYIGETGRTLEKRLSEHRGAVKRNELKNGIAVHAWKTQHRVDWEAATVKQVEMNHTRRKVIEAIHIKKQKVTSNLDCGRSLSPVWQPLLCPS